MDKKELVDAVIEMIKQDTAAGDLENVQKIMTCAFKEKLKVCLPDYEGEADLFDWNNPASPHHY